MKINERREKTKKNGVKNLKRAYPYLQLHLIPIYLFLVLASIIARNRKGLTSIHAVHLF